MASSKSGARSHRASESEVIQTTRSKPMSETEFENESNVAVIEPPAEKAEKPVRKTTRKPKAEKASSAEEVPAVAAAPEPEAEKPAEPIVDVANDAPEESIAAAPQQQNRRSDQTQAAETL